MLLSLNTLRDVILDEVKGKKFLHDPTPPVSIIDDKPAHWIIRSGYMMIIDQQ